MHLSGETEALPLTMDTKFKEDYEDFKENSNGKRDSFITITTVLHAGVM